MHVELLHAISQLRNRLVLPRAEGKWIACVPTMGALHAGHARLIEQARAECGIVVVTIFVNPLQFNRTDDFVRYPRTLENDIAFCEELGVNFVFAPDAGEMYPEPPRTFVEVERIGDYLCGPRRPGHFRGVATVVAKLLGIVQPDRAYFGEKDAQQFAVIRRMVSDLNMPVSIVAVETVREPDGLAMSSRNRNLNEHQRRTAPLLYRSLCVAREALDAGTRDVATVRAAALAVLAEEPEVRLEYFDIVDAAEMQPLHTVDRPVRIAAAAWLGHTRLIDNIAWTPAA